MNHKLNLKIALLVLAAIFVSACQTTQTEDIMVEPATDGQVDGSIAGQDGSADSSALDGAGDLSLIPISEQTMTAREMLDQVNTPLANRTIYFDFDSAKISDESLALLEVHGNFVASNGDVSLRLEGHTDERGSREYNISLGDRRAQSVRRVFLLLGASTDQLDTVSYGEEQPAELGHEEAAWSKNRRVELIYNVN
ncbi:MAG: peptidoglycan-associated lipoprotein Pal [Gammaproteobacteria bacterium]|nr:peptidoglycan-associated lipoprotein Pal [Gammaproteobacteria bacterium]